MLMLRCKDRKAVPKTRIDKYVHLLACMCMHEVDHFDKLQLFWWQYEQFIRQQVTASALHNAAQLVSTQTQSSAAEQAGKTQFEET